MKKLIFFVLLIISTISVNAQTTGNDLLTPKENIKPAGQNSLKTATMKSSSRLFKAKEDLTSVIVVIPAGSTVNILGSDSTYYNVTFNENEGYIYKRHAVIDNTPVVVTKPSKASTQVQDTQPVQNEQKSSRFTYLENKYGTNMAARLISGKIWKGMNAEMIKDSWGNPEKINRAINDNIIKEEWLYKTTWLYLENNTLADWGPRQ